MDKEQEAFVYVGLAITPERAQELVDGSKMYSNILHASAYVL